MDENSCKDKTVEDSVDDAKTDKNTVEAPKYYQNENFPSGLIDLQCGTSGSHVSDEGESSVDTSGPSCASPPKYEENQNGTMEITQELAEEADAARRETISTMPSYDTPTDYVPHVRIAPDVEEQSGTRRTVLGPPPSYSFVMKQKKKAPKRSTSETSVTGRAPPPTYAGMRGLYVSPENAALERICNLPSFTEPIWRSHSQPAFCPRCGILVLTTTHSHNCIATHVAALALCLFGCWPCCFLPYFMNVCKNAYHHCPICQAFLGAYTPW